MPARAHWRSCSSRRTARRQVRRHPAEPWLLLPSLGSAHVLRVVRGRPVGAAHRQSVRGGRATSATPKSPARRRNRRPPSPIDLGWRLNHPTNIASLALYQIDYTNRIVSTFNADPGYNEDRNVGDVKVKGFDAQFGHRFGELRVTHRVGLLQRQRAHKAASIPTAQWQDAGGDAEVDLRRAHGYHVQPTTCTLVCRPRRSATASPPTSTMKSRRATPWSTSTSTTASRCPASTTPSCSST